MPPKPSAKANVQISPPHQHRLHRAPFAVGFVLVPPAHAVVTVFRGAGGGKRAVVVGGFLGDNGKRLPSPAVAAAFDGNALVPVFGVINAHPATLRALLQGGGELRHRMIRVDGGSARCRGLGRWNRYSAGMM